MKNGLLEQHQNINWKIQDPFGEMIKKNCGKGVLMLWESVLVVD